MKIKLVSDLHLEFSDIDIPNNEECDVLILSGDIMIAEDLHKHPEPDVPYSPEIIKTLGSRQVSAQRYRDFLKRCSLRFSHVIYVAGNHEFYHGRWIGSLQHLKEECAKFSNVYFLENDIKVIDNITFIGCTLWTDMNRSDPLTLHTVNSIMTDYQIVRNDELGFTKLRPFHTVERHRKSLDFIKTTIAKNRDGRFVVVGHHAPSALSIHKKYQDDYLMNGAYHSDLSNFILDHPQVELWTHGHTHHPFDYMIGSTRVVCNPRGYEGYEPESGWDITKVIEL
jgi:predicted phosphodiesterase